MSQESPRQSKHSNGAAPAAPAAPRSTPQPGKPPADSLKSDARTIGLIGLAHGSSHFFHLLMPPLFPWLIDEFGFSYSELGVLVSIFFVVSGVGQALSGFIVDRIGARPVLFFALSCFCIAALLSASAQGYWSLCAAAAMAGLGNAPFHPADFTILNKRVSAPRLGHAFAVHGISGNLGWAVSPLLLTGIATATGSWRMASLAAACVALLIIAILAYNRDAIDDSSVKWAHERDAQASAQPKEHALAFLKLPSVWLCFSFFFWSTCALSAIQSFASPALQSMYGLQNSTAAMVVTGYMLAGVAGMIGGGFLVGRVKRLELIISICLLASAALLVLVGARFGGMTGMAALVVTALAGVGTGLAGPSRDMLIKQAAPPGATGRVYGTVYSGLDLGFSVAAPVFGWMMDKGVPQQVFYGSAIALALGVASAAMVGVQVATRRRALATA